MIPYFLDNAVASPDAIRQLISESFLTVKGAALFLPRGNGSSAPRISHRRNKHAGDLQQHLQAMFMLLRPEDNIRLAVRLESTYQNRTRYMVIVSTNGRQDTEESIVLGMDFSSNDSSVCTMGLVLPLWSDALIHLDGDGGFSVSTDNRIHIFKPVSVQAMWSALQSLHKACEVARLNNYYPGSLFLTWVSYYESHINSDQSSVNEWNAMQDVQSHRPDSPALFTDVPTERERTERLIKTKLREIMMQKDLENITSKEIRTELEMQMAYNLREFKEFIDNEMIVILGQMDSPTEIFEHVFLGSEWNASNLEELQNQGVRYILNVTREIDNFFPGVFEYHNIRVYDEEATDLLAYWNETYKFISKAKKSGSKCLVHCKMGVSRSASTVIAYAMKEYGWNLDRAYDYVKERRTVTKPNPSFMRQLEEYQGILLASKQRHNKLWRSHSDSDLSDHHEPMGKSGMEISKKEITTSADQISENKASNCHPLSLAPRLPAGPLTEHRQGPSTKSLISRKERVIQLEIAPYPAEPMEENLNLNHLNGCPPLCCLDETHSPPGNCDSLSNALLPQQGGALEVLAVGFPDLAVDDVEKDALKHRDGNIHLVPMEELESCLRDVSGQNSPSPPPPIAAAAAAAPQPEDEEEEAEFGTDRIDFFSALEKFVELSQDNRPRACSHSRAEEPGGNSGRNNLPKGAVLDLSPSDPSTEDVAPNSSARSSPQASEESSVEEEQPPLKLSEPDRLSGLRPSHSENAISVKEIVTEIESIHQGTGQGPLKMDAMNNPIPAPKRTPVQELPPEPAWSWENKLGKAEQNEGGSSIPKETPREPLKLDQETAGVLLPDAPDAEETGGLVEDTVDGCGNLKPKWCPGSVRRATLEFEERLRQEQEIQHVSPLATLPFRKNSKNESSPSDLSAKVKHGDPSHEPAQISRDKETSRSGNGPEPPAGNPSSSSPPRDGPSAELTRSASEHRLMVSEDSPEKTTAPSHLFLPPKRVEIIEYTPAVRPPVLSDTDRSGPPAVSAEIVAVDENCNTTLGSETPAKPLEIIDFRKVIFSVGSPNEEEGETAGASTDSPAAFVPANRARFSLLPGSAGRPSLCVEGVTQDSTSSDPEPARLGGYAGHGQFALEERGGFPRRRSESTLTHWNREDFDVPDTLSIEAGERSPGLLAASPLCRGLLHSSSSDSLRDLSGTSGSGREFDARIRQAGLTNPSPMKRSASLAKLDRLALSKEDISRRDRTPLCAHLVSLCAPFVRGDPAAQGPAAPPASPPPPESPRPTWHLVEQLKLTEYVALSKPVEKPPVQYAQEFNLTREPPETKLTSAQANGPPGSAAPCAPQRLAVLPRYQHGRTRPPRRPRKANDRKRTANPLYNSM